MGVIRNHHDLPFNSTDWAVLIAVLIISRVKKGFYPQMSGNSDCYINDFIQQATVATTTGQPIKPTMPTHLLQIWASLQLIQVSIWMIQV